VMPSIGKFLCCSDMRSATRDLTPRNPRVAGIALSAAPGRPLLRVDVEQIALEMETAGSSEMLPWRR